MNTYLVLSIALLALHPASSYDLRGNPYEHAARRKLTNDLLLSDAPETMEVAQFPSNPKYASVKTFGDRGCTDLIRVQSFLVDTCFIASTGYSSKYICCKTYSFYRPKVCVC
jgi:hypothetical protein